MTHFFGVVLVPGDMDTPPLDVYAAVQRAMERYDKNREVPSYRFYPDDEEIRRMREWYKTDDLRQLASHAREWDGDERGDIDEDGRLYFVSHRNIEGMWDYWLIGGTWYGEIRQKLIDFHHESNPLPDERIAMVVTPDGAWHQYDETWIREPIWQTESHEAIDEEDERRRALWYADVEELLRWNNTCIAVGLDIHR